MKIAVLAWGSLTWDRRELAITKEFLPDGPVLPIEFCRVSGDGRLTLVIDEAFGASCATYAAPSAFGDLDAAIENLRLREGMPGAKGVGFVDIATTGHDDRTMERHPKAVTTIKRWANVNCYDAAIWTALASNFEEPEKGGKPFSVQAAVQYLDRLDPLKIDLALGYIRSAPPEVRTPVRAAVDARWSKG
jgi:hypothetical protein